MATNVLLRYAFSIGSVWSQELEWHLLAPLVLVGMTYALQQGEHVRVDVFYARLPPRAQGGGRPAWRPCWRWLIALLVIRYSIGYVQQSYAIGEISSDPGGAHAPLGAEGADPAGLRAVRRCRRWRMVRWALARRLSQGGRAMSRTSGWRSACWSASSAC